MFDVGSKYEFRTIQGGDEVSFRGIIETYEHPLIKLRDIPAVKTEVTKGDDGSMSVAFNEDPNGKRTPGAVLNVTSPNFIQAVKVG